MPKKRSKNYTEEEKNILLSIIAKYQNVIDNKGSGAHLIQKKMEAWKLVTKQYNSLCTTGPRSETMLKHFYKNIKHRARKDNAIENMPIVNDKLVYNLKKKWIDEQKTGGGSPPPTLMDAEHQNLAVLDDQIQPDENPYDEEAAYFDERTLIPEVSLLNLNNLTEPIESKKINLVKSKQKFLKRNIFSSRDSSEKLKLLYYRKKIELTFYEKRNEMQKYSHEKKKHELEMKILKKQLARLEKDNFD